MTGAQRGRRMLAGSLAALVAIAAVTIGAALLNDDHDSHHDKVAVDRVDGTQQVMAALAATVDSGSYDLQFTFHIESGSPSAMPCTRSLGSGSSSCGVVAMTSTDLAGHGTVNTNPYAMTVFTDYLGGITLFVDDSTVWELGGAYYGATPNSVDPGPGSPLSGFAGLVEGTLGDGQGALTMISLANNTGYLGLESGMVTGATSDGTGVLDDGTRVTYYRVDVDLKRMADAPALSPEQRQAITDAIGVLDSVGYSGTDERIGVDDAGFIRDVVATTKFSNGGSMTRHSVLSNFGCAARVTMPNEALVTAPGGTCPPTTPTTLPAPTTTAPSTSSPTTVPPSTPPSTAPPSTVPPSTEPPSTAPPSTDPPSTTG